MLAAFGRAFKTPDLRKKILFTLFIIVVYRLGATIPSPGVSYTNVEKCINQQGQGTTDVFHLLNLFSGGALLHLTVFALGIVPYITASIILQLLVVVIPRLEQLKKEGQSGQTKITQYTRYLTIGLGVLQTAGYIALARSGQLFGPASGNSGPGCGADGTESPIFPEIAGQPAWLMLIATVMTMTAGTAAIMWLGEQITEHGVGNGMSVLMFANIAARLPTEGKAILDGKGPIVFGIVVAIGIVIIAAVVFIEQCQRRIPVQYAKRMVGRRMYGGTSTYIPLKVNQAGVVPVIFASSLLYLPQLFTQLMDTNNPGPVKTFIDRYVVDQGSWVHILLYFALILFFTYFYVAITFNPTDVADNMKKYGGFVPGIRPGRPTVEYLEFILNRITLPGAIYLGVIAILPNFFIEVAGGSQNTQSFPFGGTAVLIMVGVGLETMKQINSQLMQRNYEGFLR